MRGLWWFCFWLHFCDCSRPHRCMMYIALVNYYCCYSSICCFWPWVGGSLASHLFFWLKTEPLVQHFSLSLLTLPNSGLFPQQPNAWGNFSTSVRPRWTYGGLLFWLCVFVWKGGLQILSFLFTFLGGGMEESLAGRCVCGTARPVFSVLCLPMPVVASRDWASCSVLWGVCCAGLDVSVLLVVKFLRLSFYLLTCETACDISGWS